MQNYTLSEIADLIDAKIIGDKKAFINGLAPIDNAQKGTITFLIGAKYKHLLPTTQATAVLLSEQFEDQCPTTALVVSNPELSFAKVAALFQSKPKLPSGIHPSAIIGQNTRIDESAVISANCVLGDNVFIGANTILYPGTIIGNKVRIGDDCCLYSRVTLYDDVKIGHRVIIQSGAVLGADGFGYANDAGRWHKIPQLGAVVIEDDVEIGANTCIDRGAIVNTIVHRGVKIDNQVQIGHNVEIGEHSIIAGCTGIGGSAKIGKHCMLGGACNIGDHVSIADQVLLTGSADVPRSIHQPGIYSSLMEARPRKEWLKIMFRLGKLEEMVTRLKKLERQQNECD